MKLSSWVVGFFASMLSGLTGCGRVRSSFSTQHVPGRVQGAVDRGAVPADELIDLTIGLKLSDEESLQTFHQDQRFATDPTRRFLSPSAFADRFGIPKTDYQQMVEWLNANRLTVIRVTEGRTTITVRATAAAIERVFGTRLHRLEDGRGGFRAPLEEPQLSGPLVGHVSGIVGLDDTSRWYSHAWVADNSTVEMKPLVPHDLRALYGIVDSNGNPLVTEQGEKENIALLGAGLSPNPGDVALFAKSYLGIDDPYSTGLYQVVRLGGDNRESLDEASNEQFENLLDIDMVMAIAPQAKVTHVLVASNASGLFTDGISYIVNQLGTTVHAVSVSFGTCERGASAEMPVVNALLQQAKAEGQQWFFAAGDTGTDGCRDDGSDGVISVGWPASSPYAIGVGGEQLNDQPDRVEVAWPGGGGGASESFEKPDFQTGVTPNDGARDEPDVAALAGPPGVALPYVTIQIAILGTSAASPMWAAIWALIDQSKGGQGLPTGRERLYELGAQKIGFHDITTGDNGNGNSAKGYSAQVGYDLATGWGSPDVVNLINHWDP